jgi:hypothetical protein
MDEMGAPSLPTRAAVRTNGFLFVVVLVVLGVGVTGALYRWRAGELADNAAAARGSLPRTPEERLDRWLEFAQVFVHQSLVQLRFSADQPWLVTHTIASSRNAPGQEIWGIDLSGISTRNTQREGLAAVVSLPPVTLLGRGAITGDNARHVAHYVPGAPIADPEERARTVIESALKRWTKPLAKDIEGARLVVRIGDVAAQAEPGGE